MKHVGFGGKANVRRGITSAILSMGSSVPAMEGAGKRTATRFTSAKRTRDRETIMPDLINKITRGAAIVQDTGGATVEVRVLQGIGKCSSVGARLNITGAKAAVQLIIQECTVLTTVGAGAPVPTELQAEV